MRYLAGYPFKTAADLGLTEEQLAEQVALADEVIAEVIEEERQANLLDNDSDAQ